MAEKRIANARTRIITKLNKLAERLKESAEDLGFVVSVGKVNLDSAALKVKSGNISIGVIIHDEDDISIKVPKKASDLLDIASYASFKSSKQAIRFLRTVADRINS